MRRRLAIAALATLVWAFAAPAVAASAQRVFGDAVATCDNRGACSILAVAGRQDEDPAWLWLEREPDATALLALSVRVPRGAPPDRRWQLYVDERPVHEVDRDEIVCDADETPGLCEGVDLAGAALVEPLVRRLLDAAHLTVTADGAVIGNVSLRGVKAAALWIDERQARLDTPGALVRRGSRPFRQPAPAPLPAVRAASEAWAPQRAGAARILDAARSTLEAADCSRDGRGGDRLWRHRDGRWLAALDCMVGAYGVASRWLVSRDARQWQPLALDAPFIDDAVDEGRGLLREADFDETLGTLATRMRSRGVGDCGIERSFVDAGSAFVLYLDRRMPICRGVPPDRWPVAYRAILAD